MERKTPHLTVDILIYDKEKDKIVLVKRGKEPFKHGWVLPGGFVEYGERAENAAVREAKEETNLDVELKSIMGVYSDPNRDPRFHTCSVVFVAKAFSSEIRGGDDAAEAMWFDLEDIDMSELGFDHGKIVRNFLSWRNEKESFWSSKTNKKSEK